MANVIGAFYLHSNGSLIYKPLVAFASDPEYFESSFVKHVWTILDEPPNPSKEGQVEWLFTTFLKEAYDKGASVSEVARIVDITRTSDQYKEILSGYSTEEITEFIIENKIDIFLKGIADGR